MVLSCISLVIHAMENTQISIANACFVSRKKYLFSKVWHCLCVIPALRRQESYKSETILRYMVN